jgi:hypothetical protein
VSGVHAHATLEAAAQGLAGVGVAGGFGDAVVAGALEEAVGEGVEETTS